MITTAQAQKAREYVETKIGRVPDQTWGYLTRKQYVDEFVSEHELDKLVKEALELRALRSSDRDRARILPREAKREGHVDRDEAVSRLLAARASQEPDVIGFRDEILGGRLLKAKAVDTWISAQIERDHPQRLLLDQLLLPEWKARWSDDHWEFDPPVKLSMGITEYRHPAWAPTLELAKPGYADQRMKVSAGGMLDRLRRIADELSHVYGWDAPRTTLFVLTGLIPMIEGLAIEYRWSFHSARLVMSVDPAVSPRELTTAYSRIRERIVGARHRRLSDKHLQLALFVAGRTANERIRDQMLAWNKLYPTWRYTQETIFGRDRLQARRRVLYPRYPVLVDLDLDRTEEVRPGRSGSTTPSTTGRTRRSKR